MTLLKHWAVVGFVLMLAACQQGKAADESTDKEEEKIEPVPVEVARTTQGSIDAVYTGTASLEADNEAHVKAKVGGELIKLLVEEGDVVTAEQPLATIDREMLQLEVKRAKANLEKMRQDYRRNVELHEKGLLPAGTFEGMRYDLDALQVAYDLARLQLSYTTIRAPISGVVSARHIKAGNNVTIGDTLFTITDLDPLLAYLHVPEKDFQKLTAKQVVNLLVDALPGQIFTGEIARISPVVDAQTGTFKVTIEMNDDSGALKPGMFGRVAIVYKTFADAVLVPRSALIDSDGNSSVFVVSDGVAKQRLIETGHISGANVQVVNGLTVGETIVVIGQNGLKDNGAVKVVNAQNDDTVQPGPKSRSAVANRD